MSSSSSSSSSASASAPASSAGGQLLLFGCGQYAMMSDIHTSSSSSPSSSSSSSSPHLNVYVPTPVPALGNALVRSIAFGSVHACVVTTEGTVLSFGHNSSGQLGHGDLVERRHPHQNTALDAKSIVSVSCGYEHTAYVSVGGECFVCGAGEYGQLGTNDIVTPLYQWDLSNHSTPALCKSLRADRVAQVACGESHTLVLTADGEVFSAGDASRGALGHERGKWWNEERTRLAVFRPIELLSPLPIVSIACGAHHSLVLTAAGSVYAWGQSRRGQTGHGSSQILYTPKRIEALHRIPIAVIAAAGDQSAVISRSGHLYMFGANTHGQLGVGDTEPQFVPRLVERHHFDYRPVVRVAVGYSHTLAVTDDHSVYAWGQADQGQLGLRDASALLARDRDRGRRHASMSDDGDDAANAHAHVLATSTVGSHDDGNGDEHDAAAIAALLLDQLTPARIDHPNLRDRYVLSIAAGSDTSAIVVSSFRTPIPAGTPRFALCDDFPPTYAATSQRFDAAHLRQLADTAQRTSRYEPVVQYVSRVFSSPTLLNASFLPIHSVSRLSSSLASASAALSTTDPLTTARRHHHNHRHVDAHTRSVLERTLESASELRHAFMRRETFTSRRRSHGGGGNGVNGGDDDQPMRSYLDPTTTISTDADDLVIAADNADADDIDFRAVDDAYKEVLRLAVPEPRVAKALAHAIQQCMQALLARLKLPHPPTDFAAYRCLAIALQAPHLSTAGDAEVAVIHDCATALFRMPNAVRDRLVQCWSRCTPEILGARLVRSTANAIMQRLLRDQRAQLSVGHVDASGNVFVETHLRTVSEEIQQMVRLLALLYDANQRGGHLVADRHFELDIGAHVDVTNDFVQWRTAPATTAQLPPFSFCRYPYLLSAKAKATVMYAELALMQQQRVLNAVLSEQQPYITINVRRDKLVESTVYELNRFAAWQLQRPLRVVFVGEQGVDQGGLSSEFFRLIFRELLGGGGGGGGSGSDSGGGGGGGGGTNDTNNGNTAPTATATATVSPSYDLFEYSDEHRTLYFSKHDPNPSKIDLFYIVGELLAMAICNRVQVHVSFPSVLYAQLLRHELTLDDLESHDPQLASGLRQLLAYDGGDDEHVFGLCFALTEEIKSTTVRMGANGQPETITESRVQHVDLVPKGADLPVTADNKHHYVQLLVRHHLVDSVRAQSDAFVRGFRAVCDLRSLSLFTAHDLELLLIGTPVMNFADLRRSCRYEGGYTATHPAIEAFWDIVLHESTDDERLALLIFCTGNSRCPLGGLSALNMVIQRAGPDSEQIPTSSTCFHTLLLPEYASKEKMRGKLRVALANAEGFGLQ